ncbi:CrpP family ICE-associated protein [Pseudomonas sp. Marseille-P8916]|uniref:CrpP family ICE-associated protein n=1 Tax=Pseudomonas sp. Marseille-P8916 TaxID=2866589 RepID=UPI001CE40C89|nr:CrpP family ICE-associated protein [Pseudomonas sp. Marseille-P8916]
MQNVVAQERKADRRQFNNPHPAVEAAGAEAAEKGLPVHACPYKHPAMLASWLKGYKRSQQLTLNF